MWHSVASGGIPSQGDAPPLDSVTGPHQALSPRNLVSCASRQWHCRGPTFRLRNENLGCPLPRPKLSRSLPAALPAAPASLPFIDAEVLWGEQMPLGTRLRYTEYLLEWGLEQLIGVAEAHDNS